MIAAGGRSIVRTSSISAVAATPNEVVYNTSKGACHMFARAIAVEYRDHNIRCNAVCPGFVRTPHGLREVAELNKLGVDVSDAALAVQQGRIREPEEVARAALFSRATRRASSTARISSSTTASPRCEPGEPALSGIGNTRTLELPQIESGDIVSGLTTGHQIGHQLPGHGRQCQANVLVPYRIVDRGAFETTNARKIVGKHRSGSNPARTVGRAIVAQLPKEATQSRPFSRVGRGVRSGKLHEARSA